MRKHYISVKIFITLILILSSFYSSAIAQETQEQIEVEKLIMEGIKLYNESEFEKALEIFSRALDRRENIAHKTDEIFLNYYIAEIWKMKSEYVIAIKHYEQAIKISRDIGERWFEATCLNLLGNLYMLKMHDPFTALDYLKKSQRILRDINDKVYECYVVMGIGNAYSFMGDFSKGLEYFVQALTISKNLNNKELEFHALENIGNFYLSICDWNKAVYYFYQSLKLREETNPEDKMNTLRLLGYVYHLEGNYSEALGYFEKCLNIAAKIGDKNKEGFFQLFIGRAYTKMGKYPDALYHYNLALKKYRETNDTSFESSVLSEIGWIYIILKNWSEALIYIELALKISKDNGDKDSTRYCSGIAGIAYMGLKKNEKALSHFKDSINILDSARGKIQQEEHKIRYFENKNYIYDHIIALFYRLHYKGPHKNYAKDAFIYIEKAKARALLEIIAEAKFGIKMGLTQKDVEYEDSLFRNIETLRKSMMKVKREEEMSIINEKLITAIEKLEKFKIEIRKLNPMYASIQYPQPFTLHEVQSKLLKNQEEALLEYYIGNENSFLFVITKEKYEFLKLDKSNSELAEDIEKLRAHLEGIEKSILELKKFDISLAHNLYKQLIAPAIPYLKGIKHLIIIPHGCLHYLPFEMLIKNPVNKKTNENVLFSEYQNSHYFIEDYNISYSPSSSVLDPKLLHRKRIIPVKGELLAFANPDFEDFSQEKKDEFIENLFLTKGLRQRIEKLPYSKQEIEKIKKYYNNPLILMGKDAKEEIFVENSPFYPTIHLSTHGFVNEAHPIYSGLVFSYNENIKDVDILHAHEIFNINLNCDLVTLSACETALGQDIEKIGGEGVVGLTRSFLYAGAKSLVVSLWKVEDESTSYIMSEFYRYMKEKGLSKVEALREAKLALMKKERKIGNKSLSYSHPFFWAPFILIGESN